MKMKIRRKWKHSERTGHALNPTEGILMPPGWDPVWCVWWKKYYEVEN